MPQTIVFDLFGVILRIQADEAKLRLEQLSGAPFWDAYWACRPAHDAGWSSRDYWTAVTERADMLFFDDSESNVIAAREVGMTAAVFTSPEQVRALLARS
jgi:hypothetical protein